MSLSELAKKSDTIAQEILHRIQYDDNDEFLQLAKNVTDILMNRTHTLSAEMMQELVKIASNKTGHIKVVYKDRKKMRLLLVAWRMYLVLIYGKLTKINSTV